MNEALFNLALAAAGLPAVVGGVFLVARHFVYRDTDATFRASVIGELKVANAEAAHRKQAPQQRSPQPARKELVR